MTLEKAAMAIPTGLNKLTKTGPFLFMHQVITEKDTTLPIIACNIVFHIGGMSLAINPQWFAACFCVLAFLVS